MTSDRRAALTAGAQLIVGSVSSVLAYNVLENPVLTGTGYLTTIAANAGRVSTGALLELVAAGTSAGIAIALYPVLRKRSEGLAVGAVAFRTLEAAMYAVAAVITLALLSLARHHAALAGGVGIQESDGGIQAIGDALTGVRQSAILAGVFAYITGALMYYFVFYRWRLVPRWLSVWGIAAEALMLAACVTATFHGTAVTSYTALIVPIGIQEPVLAVWLIVRGFGASESLQPGDGAAKDPVVN